MQVNKPSVVKCFATAGETVGEEIQTIDTVTSDFDVDIYSLSISTVRICTISFSLSTMFQEPGLFPKVFLVSASNSTNPHTMALLLEGSISRLHGLHVY
jgi:hypothetical protein